MVEMVLLNVLGRFLVPSIFKRIAKLLLPHLSSIARMKKVTKAILLGIILSGVCLTSLADGAGEEFPVAPPPMTEGMFPCSNCHATMEVNRKKRELKEEHAQIKLHHAETMRWCLDCHDAKNRDKLRLYNGELINFTESYRLCGECHGPQYVD